MWTDSLSPVFLDPAGDLEREPPRPPEFRQPGYEEAFDYHTLFFDAFFAMDGDRVIMIGPPLLNLAALLSTLKVTAGRLHIPCETHFVEQTYLTRLIVELPDRNATHIILSGQFGRWQIPIQPNLSRIFQGKRVLLTQSQDNELNWIVDWIKFHVVHHGCDAVLLYDNASSQYTVSELDRIIGGIDGIGTHLVVAWPHKHGAGRWRNSMWDSNYGQRGMLEHARWRFLQTAKSVLSIDVDELVIHDQGKSIYDFVEQSTTGHSRFEGRWIGPYAERAEELSNFADRRHRDFIYLRTQGKQQCAHKWAVVPSRCDFADQWLVHKIGGEKHRQKSEDGGFEFRHFAALSRKRTVRIQTISASEAVRDDLLMAAFEKVT